MSVLTRSSIPTGLVFHEELDGVKHVYTLHGKRLPSVTRILSVLDPVDENDPRIIAAAARGTIVHDATDLYDMGALNFDGVPEECRGYVWAYQAFRAQCPFEIIDSELPVVHKAHCYAGRVDRVVAMRGKTTILDIKSGVERPIAKIQLAAYGEAYFDTTGTKIKQSACVYLRPDGTYALKWQDDASAFHTFISALRVYRWRENHR